MMEEKGAGQGQPVKLRCAYQPELLSLMTSGREETTQEKSELVGKEQKNTSSVNFLVFVPTLSGSAWLSDIQPLSGSQLIRVRDKAMEQHGPSVSVAPINKGSTARRQPGEAHTADT